MKTLIIVVLFLSSVANAATPYFKCYDGTVLRMDGKTLNEVWFRFVPSTLHYGYYIIEMGDEGEGGYSVGKFESYERPNELVQLVATGYGEDSINGRPVRIYEVSAIAERAKIDGAWSVRRTVRVKTSSSDKTYVDMYSFEPQNCSWH